MGTVVQQLLLKFLLGVLYSETDGQVSFRSCSLEHDVSAYFVFAIARWDLAEEICEKYNLTLTTDNNIIEACMRHVGSNIDYLCVWSHKRMEVCYCQEFEYGIRSFDHQISCAQSCGFICHKDVPVTIKTRTMAPTTIHSSTRVPSTTSTREQNATYSTVTMTTSGTPAIQKNILKRTTVSTGVIAGLVVGLLLVLCICVAVILIVLVRRGLIKFGNRGNKPCISNPGDLSNSPSSPSPDRTEESCTNNVTTVHNYFEVEPHTLCPEDHSVAPGSPHGNESASNFRHIYNSCSLYSDDSYPERNRDITQSDHELEEKGFNRPFGNTKQGHRGEETGDGDTYDRVNKSTKNIVPDNVYSHTGREVENEYSHVNINNPQPLNHQDVYNHIGSVTLKGEITGAKYDHSNYNSSNNHGQLHETTYSRIC